MSEGDVYLLDTTVLVDLSRKREPAASWSRRMLRGPNVVGVSPVNVAEFFAGLRPAERTDWGAFVAELEYWHTTPRVAMRAGILRYEHARQGKTILLPDALIAATALDVGAILVTNNVEDFPMPELRVLRLGA